MAVYTDFFLASDEDLQEALPLRVPPLCEPCAGEEATLPQWKPSKPFSEKALSADFPTDAESDAIDRFEKIASKNLTPDRLEELHALLGGDPDEFSDSISRPPLMAPGDFPYGGLFQLPSEFVAALAKIPKSQLGEITEQWLGSRGAKSTVVALSKMARQAIEHGKKMFLWMVV